MITGTLLILAAVVGLSLWDACLQRGAEFDEAVDQAFAVAGNKPDPTLFESIAATLAADLDAELEDLLHSGYNPEERGEWR